ncbi:MAG: hypothetical protein ABI729_04745 [Chitinophagales bacterium]
MSYIIPKGFASRHIGVNDKDIKEMLQVIGADSLDELIAEVVPENIKNKKSLSIGTAVSEQEYLESIRAIAKKNKLFRTYIGMGYYNTFTPPAILRNLFENPGWYTQYTPYQAEIAQGRLESLLNFQTMVIDLTGMEVANASLLDESTAAAEAMIMLFHAREKSEEHKNIFFVSEKVFPQTIDLLKTRSAPLGIQLLVGDHETISWDQPFYGAIVQYPDGDGEATDYAAFIHEAHQAGARVVMAADLLALTLMKSPGELGADVAVGSAQRFGVPLGYGGPHAAYFATRDAYKRQMPGRIIGVSIDADGNQAFRMALQTREQHIKREKATSNICTAQALLANMAAMYAVYHGPEGLKEIALTIHNHTVSLAQRLGQLGIIQENSFYFDTLKLDTDTIPVNEIKRLAVKAGINFRYFETGEIGVSLDETVGTKEVDAIVSVFAKAAGKENPLEITEELNLRTNPDLVRESSYLTHPVFNRHHSESQLMRYMKSLENKDLSLNTSMISLGSCTMKLNAAS